MADALRQLTDGLTAWSQIPGLGGHNAPFLAMAWAISLGLLAACIGRKYGGIPFALGQIGQFLLILIAFMDANHNPVDHVGRGLQQGPFEAGLALMVSFFSLAGGAYWLASRADHVRAADRSAHRSASFGLYSLMNAGGLLCAFADNPTTIWAGLILCQLAMLALAAFGSTFHPSVASRSLDRLLFVAPALALIGLACVMTPLRADTEHVAGLIGLAVAIIGTLTILSVGAGAVSIPDFDDILADRAGLAPNLAHVSALVVLLRWLAELSGSAQALSETILLAIGLIGLMSAIIAGFGAIWEQNARRLIARTLSVQTGLIVFCAAMAAFPGIERAAMLAALLGFIHLCAVSLILGPVLARLSQDSDLRHLSRLRGLGHSTHWISASLIIACISLLGAPFTFGFIARWHLIDASLQASLLLPALGVGLISAFLLIALGRIFEATLLSPHNAGSNDLLRSGDNSLESIGAAPKAPAFTAKFIRIIVPVQAALWLLVLGISPQSILPYVEKAAYLFAGTLSSRENDHSLRASLSEPSDPPGAETPGSGNDPTSLSSSPRSRDNQGADEGGDAPISDTPRDDSNASASGLGDPFAPSSQPVDQPDLVGSARPVSPEAPAQSSPPDSQTNPKATQRPRGAH